jgi:putative serine protease PepD
VGAVAGRGAAGTVDPVPGGQDEEADGPEEASIGEPSFAPPDGFDIPLHLTDDVALGLHDLDDPLDDDLNLSASSGRPLPPDDRLWRHPSEIATTGLPAAATPPPPTRMPRRAARMGRPIGYGQRLVAVGLSGMVGALLMAGLLVATGRLSRVDVATELPTSTSSAVAVRSSVAASAAALVAKVQAGVLSVRATKANDQSVRGSALVLQPGYAITALHIVEGATHLSVQVEGEPRVARLVGSDAETDLALLIIEGATVEPPAPGSSSALRPGDTAVTLTAPPGASTGPSVTVGVVSALDRTMVAGKNVLRGMLQLDRPIPAEGAGGALLDAMGNVVGVTLPAADPGTQIGYAIPIDAVNEVSRQLLMSGHVARPWLGIDGGDDDATGGASVYQVKPSSPAARAGVQAGDVVTAMDGTPVKSMDGMLRLLRAHTPGDTVRLTILRKGKPVDLLVTLAER